MLKIFIKSLIVLILCANTLYSDEYLPSTSPDIKILKRKQKVQKLQKADNKNVITFSEFSSGTKITDQYADRGIIFKGDSPFITSDGANPTSPVLSGTPTFDGAIEGHFVDSITHEPTTVNHFELDGGYFNNLSSTKLSWFNPDGELIREVLDSKYGIEHFTVDDENIASFRIEVISQEDAGYAIDNVSFKIQEFSLDKITHKAGSPIANTFTIYLKSSDKGLEGICDYKFFVEDANQKIEGTGCKVKDNNVSKVDFIITKSPYNLENAKVTICKNNKCKEITDIKNFSVYATNFDVTKDGFSFKNGEWNKFMLIQNKEISVSSFFCWKFDFCTDNQISYQGSMIRLVNAFKEFMPSSKKEEAKDLIGYYKIKDYTEGYDSRDRKFGGVCHGLAVSAIANFNNKDEQTTWGIDLDLLKSKDEIVSIFQNHWDNKESESAKPFSKSIHSYNASSNISDAFHSLGKIGYYFLSQNSYSGGKAWVGTHKRRIFSSITDMNIYHEMYFKKNRVSSFRFSINHTLSASGGHSIIATGLIKYNNHSIYLLHDNNFVDTFSMLDFNNNLIPTKFIYDKYKGTMYDKYKDFRLADFYRSSSYSKFGTYSNTTDELFIYGKSKDVNKMNKRAMPQKVVNNKETFDYPYPNHISISIVGGKLLKVTDTQTQKKVVLNPIIGRLEEGKGYLKDNMLITEFLLPKNSIYKIELQKYKQYSAFEVYAKIPTNDGKVEIINYENLATNEDDSTLAHFLVGNGNNDKDIKRDGESDVAPTYDEAIDMKITSATFVKAVALSSGVKLTWNLPNNPNLKEVVIVRKENSQPTSMTDGSEVYRGTDESYTDSSAGNNREYYYAIYAVSKNGDVAEGQFIYVNTHQATLFGYVKDGRNSPVTSVKVILKNGVGLVKKVINTEVTDKNGYFSFGNLPLGTYLIEFSHSNYTFENNGMTVNLENKNTEVTQEAIGQPMLAMSVNMVMKVDENETISWDGINIPDSATINVKLKRANTWETLASGIEFSKHHIKWKVTEPKDENATLKIELASDTTMYSEKKVYIFKPEELKYDFDGDGDIDIDDIMKVANAWLSKTGDSKFKSEYDYNGDGIIDIKDIMKIASQWGK